MSQGRQSDEPSGDRIRSQQMNNANLLLLLHLPLTTGEGFITPADAKEHNFLIYILTYFVCALSQSFFCFSVLQRFVKNIHNSTRQEVI